MRRRLFLILAFPGAVLAQERAPHNEEITAAKLRADLAFLAGDHFRGRLGAAGADRPRPATESTRQR